MSSAFSWFPNFLLLDSSLDTESTWGVVFPFTYFMSKLNTISLTTNLKILDNITLMNSFLGFNNEFYFASKIFVLIRSFVPSPCSTLVTQPSLLQYSSCLFFTAVKFLDRYIIRWPCDMIAAMAYLFVAVVSTTSFFYLDASFNRCTYCLIDSFGSCVVFMNLILSATTSFFFFGRIFFFTKLTTLLKLILLILLGRPSLIFYSQLHNLP